MNIESTLKDIKALIAEANKCESVDRLLEINLRLAGYQFFLAEFENNAMREYFDAYNNRKYMFAKFTIEGNGSAADRATNAEIAVKDYREIEKVSELLLHKAKSSKQTVSEFIGVLTQKISVLKVNVSK